VKRNVQINQNNELDELKKFLHSMRTAERLRDLEDLQRKLNCKTDLLDALKQAIQQQRNVIITGSAGGGKTHLLDEVRRELKESSDPKENSIQFVHFADPEPSDDYFVRWHEDGTKLTEKQQEQFFQIPGNGIFVIAINEGPLRDLKDKEIEIVEHGIDFLERGQQGQEVRNISDDKPLTDKNDIDPNKHPVVIDVAGFSPVEPDILSEVFGNPLLFDLMVSEYGKTDPRTIEWKLLQNQTVIERVTRIIQLASLDGEPVLWRQLWNLIGDMTLGVGTATDGSWYQRLIYGNSNITKRIRNFFSLSDIALPGIDFALWEGGKALERFSADIDATLPPIPTEYRTRSIDHEKKLESFRTAQLRYLLGSKTEHPSLNLAMGKTPWLSKNAKEVEDLIGRINHYRIFSTYCPSLASKNRLHLLLNTGFSIRDKLSTTQVLLGKIKSDDLEIKRSKVVLGFPDCQTNIEGTRYFLQKNAAPDGNSDQASLRLTGELWNQLLRQRATSSTDRKSRELDIDLDRFFYSLIMTDDELGIVDTNLDSMESSLVMMGITKSGIEYHS
jgi:hypothetical protein